MSYLGGLDKIRAELQEQFPGWQIWFVPRSGRTTTWCARPWPLLNTDSPEQLAADIIHAHEEAAAEWPALASPADYRQSAPRAIRPVGG